MTNVRWFHLFSYVIVSLLAVGFAFMISLRFVTRSHSQTGAIGAIPTAPAEPAKQSASDVANEVQGFLEPFIYESKNRRDPFQAYAEYRPVETQVVMQLPPLQRYDIDELKLVGIMWDVRDPKAMFVDPDKQVHVAGRDESIGKKNGYIATIREGEIVIVESSRKDGEVQFKPRVVRIDEQRETRQ